MYFTCFYALYTHNYPSKADTLELVRTSKTLVTASCVIWKLLHKEISLLLAVHDVYYTFNYIVLILSWEYIISFLGVVNYFSMPNWTIWNLDTIWEIKKTSFQYKHLKKINFILLKAQGHLSNTSQGQKQDTMQYGVYFNRT